MRLGIACCAAASLMCIITQAASAEDLGSLGEGGQCTLGQRAPSESSDVRKFYEALYRLADPKSKAPVYDWGYAKFEKTEYETAAQFDARVQAVLGRLPRRVAVVANTPSLGTYDAESGTLTVTMADISRSFDDVRGPVKTIAPQQSQSGPSYQSDTYLFVPALSISRKARSYIGENGFGATSLISETRDAQWGIAIARHESIDHGEQHMATDIKLPLPPELAQKERPTLQLVIVGQLTSPYEFDDLSGVSPTLENQTDDMTYRHAIVLDKVCVALRGRVSGRTYAVFGLP